MFRIDVRRNGCVFSNARKNLRTWFDAKNPMRIYTRHILKGFLGLFLLCFVSAVIIFLMIDFVGNSRLWLTRPPDERYRYYLNYLPYIMYLVCPIAVLLASTFSVGRLAKYLELVALRSAGIS